MGIARKSGPSNLAKLPGRRSMAPKNSSLLAAFDGISTELSAQFIENNTNIECRRTTVYYEAMQNALSDMVRQEHPDWNEDQIAVRVATLVDQIKAPLALANDHRPPLPNSPRITYSERTLDPALAGTNIIEFLRAEYGPWLDGTLTRRDLRRIDPSAATAIENWLRKNSLPDEISLPTLKEANDVAVADREQVRMAWRLTRAAQRRAP